jgi:hypothetical protein
MLNQEVHSDMETNGKRNRTGQGNKEGFSQYVTDLSSEGNLRVNLEKENTVHAETQEIQGLLLI